MLMTLVTTVALIGAILGLRFKVLVLVPAFVISSVAIFGTEKAHSDNPSSILLTVLLAITALQMGYLAGALICSLVAKTRARKDLSRIITVAQKSP
jgi:hypothetical protein